MLSRGTMRRPLTALFHTAVCAIFRLPKDIERETYVN